MNKDPATTSSTTPTAPPRRRLKSSKSLETTDDNITTASVAVDVHISKPARPAPPRPAAPTTRSNHGHAINVEGQARQKSYAGEPGRTNVPKSPTTLVHSDVKENRSKSLEDNQLSTVKQNLGPGSTNSMDRRTFTKSPSKDKLSQVSQLTVEKPNSMDRRTSTKSLSKDKLSQLTAEKPRLFNKIKHRRSLNQTTFIDSKGQEGKPKPQKRYSKIDNSTTSTVVQSSPQNDRYVRSKQKSPVSPVSKTPSASPARPPRAHRSTLSRSNGNSPVTPLRGNNRQDYRSVKKDSPKPARPAPPAPAKVNSPRREPLYEAIPGSGSMNAYNLATTYSDDTDCSGETTDSAGTDYSYVDVGQVRYLPQHQTPVTNYPAVTQGSTFYHEKNSGDNRYSLSTQRGSEQQWPTTQQDNPRDSVYEALDIGGLDDNVYTVPTTAVLDERRHTFPNTSALQGFHSTNEVQETFEDDNQPYSDYMSMSSTGSVLSALISSTRTFTLDTRHADLQMQSSMDTADVHPPTGSCSSHTQPQQQSGDLCESQSTSLSASYNDGSKRMMNGDSRSMTDREHTNADDSVFGEACGSCKGDVNTSGSGGQDPELEETSRYTQGEEERVLDNEEEDYTPLDVGTMDQSSIYQIPVSSH